MSERLSGVSGLGEGKMGVGHVSLAIVRRKQDKILEC